MGPFTCSAPTAGQVDHTVPVQDRGWNGLLLESCVRMETDFRARQKVKPKAVLISGEWSRRWSKPLALYLILASVAGIVLKPILGSAFSADDTFDSFLPMNLRYSGGSFWQFVSDVVTGWRKNEGRLFPVAVIVGGLSHLLFPERTEYKIVQWLLAVAVVVLVAGFVSMFVRNIWAGVSAGLLLLSASQMRVQYDPFLQFSLQQPTVALLWIVSLMVYLKAVRKSDTWLLFASMCLFLLATLTYETSLLFWPVFPLLALVERRAEFFRWSVPTVIPPVLVGCYLLYLRSGVAGTSAGYTSNFSPYELGLTFAKQFYASLPMTYSEINPPPFVEGFPGHLDFSNGLWLSAVGTAAAMVAFAVPRLPRPDWLRIGVLMAIGLTVWSFSSLVVAQTSRWQDEIVSGNAYIPVYQGNIGFSLVALSAIMAAARLFERRRHVLNLLRVIAVVLVAVSLSSVVTNNVRASSQFDSSFRHPRDFFTEAVRKGVFSDASETSVILSVNSEWWFKPAFVNWYGGPRLCAFVTPQEGDVYAECVHFFADCRTKEGITHYMGLYGRSPTETRVIIVGRVSRMTGTRGQIKGIRIVAPLVFVDYPRDTPSQDGPASRARCIAWLVSRLQAMGEMADSSLLTVRKADERTCLVGAAQQVTLNPLLFTAS